MKKNIICAFFGLMLLGGLCVNVQAMQKGFTKVSNNNNFFEQMKGALKEKKRLSDNKAMTLLETGVGLFFSDGGYRDIFTLISNQDFLKLNFPPEYSRYILIDSQLNNFLISIVQSAKNEKKLLELLRAIFNSKYLKWQLIPLYIEAARDIAKNKGFVSVDKGFNSILSAKEKPVVYDQQKHKEACKKLRNIR